MMETKQQKTSFWYVRIVVSFNKNRIKFNVLVYEETQAQAKEKAVEWAKKYVEDNSKRISESIGYDAVMTEQPRVQVLRTYYATVL